MACKALLNLWFLSTLAVSGLGLLMMDSFLFLKEDPTNQPENALGGMQTDQWGETVIHHILLHWLTSRVEFKPVRRHQASSVPHPNRWDWKFTELSQKCPGVSKARPFCPSLPPPEGIPRRRMGRTGWCHLVSAYSSLLSSPSCFEFSLYMLYIFISKDKIKRSTVKC